MPVISNGGKTYTIKLRPGVKFQPPVSREVTAADFKYSVERMMRLPLAPATYFYTGIVGAKEYQAGKAAHIAGIKVVDTSTLQIDLEAARPLLPQGAHHRVLRRRASEWVQKWGNKAFGRHPLGTGPFIFVNWTPGQDIVLKRNPNYWKLASRISTASTSPSRSARRPRSSGCSAERSTSSATISRRPRSRA